MLRAVLLVALLHAGVARADGAFPDELQIFLPADQPHRIVLATNFGLLVSDDDGAVWHWVCEQAVTASLANLYQLGRGPAHVIYSATDLGLSVSEDSGCGWSYAGGALGGAFVLDVFADPSDPTAALAIGTPQTDGGAAQMGLYRSSDGGRSFGAPLYQAPLTQFLTGVEVAATDALTIYMTAHHNNPRVPQLLRSTDGGANWTTLDLDATPGARVIRLAAVDPNDAQKLYLRAEEPSGDLLAIASGGGASVRVAAQLGGAMSAFLRRTNGTLLVGTRDAGGMESTDGGATFHVWPGAPHLRALAERGGLLYAAGDNTADHFALGIASDGGRSWQPLLTLDRICGPLDCVAATCAVPWQMLQTTLAISPQACNPVLPPDAGAPDAPAATGGGGGGGCGCSVAARAPAGWLLLLLPLIALLLRCGEDGVALPWTHTFTIPAGTFVEANLVMAAGDTATCEFSAQGGALDWNTHGHTSGGGLLVLTQGQGASGSLPLTAPSGGGYSFYFQNNGGLPVTLDVRITGRGRVVSTSVGP